MPRFVVTGAPGTGKTSVIALLADQFATVREPARELIAEHRAATGETTLDHRPEVFVTRLVARSIDDFNAAPGGDVVFFDRGLPDCAAYASGFGIDPRPVLETAADFRYESPVFVAPPWKEIYTTDALRRATFEQIAEFDVHVRRAYAHLGYEMIELPKASPENRADFVMGRLRPTGIRSP